MKKPKAEAKRNLPKVGCEVCDNRGQIRKLDLSGEYVMHECTCLLAYRQAKREAV